MSGIGQSSQQTSQQSQSQTAPWAPAQPELGNILNGIGNINPGVTPAQQAALAQLQANAGGIQNFQGQATGAANNFIGGDPTGLLGPAYQQYQQTMNPIANASLNPMNTPGFSDALNTMNQGITQQVNGEFAGAGRSGSGLNTQQLARGLSQGDSQAIANQYNANVGNVQNAASGILGGAQATSGAMAGNTATGLGMASTVPGFAAQTPNAMLSALAQQFNLGPSQLGALENLTVPIAGLGSQSSGSSQGQTTNNLSPVAEMLAFSQMFKNLLPSTPGTPTPS